ncbi:MAG: type II toxin-antitoxin system PemK/MazF family toxin [Bryobacteraceae bacterium]
MVVLNFPFSDLSQTKRRPALVLATLTGDDLILCQITSQAKSDQYSVPLDLTSFEFGGLRQLSWIRPNRIFTAVHSCYTEDIAKGPVPPRIRAFSNFDQPRKISRQRRVPTTN